MKLYHAPGTCSRAVHIALLEASIPATLERVDLRSKRTASGRDFLEINPLGYVPALELESGEVILEAPAILLYVADLAPAGKLAPADGSLERVKLVSALSFIASELHKSFSPFFGPVKPEGEARDRALARLASRFDEIERRLSDGRSYLLGETFTVADCYCFVVAGWTAFIGVDLARWPHVSAYVTRIRERPSVREAIARES